ncbi:MAG TPA: PKD domain-containing protein [Candidatus Bathyarchaeia archaeon]|nr:PKD domain-containing protein [Candidatus Bathyarchaeia archaeon]
MKKELIFVSVLFIIFASLSPSFCLQARAEPKSVLGSCYPTLTPTAGIRVPSSLDLSKQLGSSATALNSGKTTPLAVASSLSFAKAQNSGEKKDTTSGAVSSNTSDPVSSIGILVLTLGSIGTSSSDTIASISQTGIMWSKAVSKSTSQGSNYYDNEIWYGNVTEGSSYSGGITIYFNNLPTSAIADHPWFFPYRLALVDKTATNSGTSASTDTGTIASTNDAQELWIGSTLAAASAQTNPRNGFLMYDGALTNGISEAYLWNISNTAGPADSGTTLTASEPWSGCIATFYYNGTWALGAYADPGQISGNSPVSGILSYGSWGSWQSSSATYYLGDDVLTMSDGSYGWQIVEMQIGQSYYVQIECWDLSNNKAVYPQSGVWPTWQASNVQLGTPYNMSITYNSTTNAWQFNFGKRILNGNSISGLPVSDERSTIMKGNQSSVAVETNDLSSSDFSGGTPFQIGFFNSASSTYLGAIEYYFNSAWHPVSLTDSVPTAYAYLGGSLTSVIFGVGNYFAPTWFGEKGYYYYPTTGQHPESLILGYGMAQPTYGTTLWDGPSVSISPTSVTLDVGQSQTFTSSASRGKSPYSYKWYQNGTAVSGATSSSWTLMPSTAGSYTVYVVVTDSLDVSAKSNAATVTVNSALWIGIISQAPVPVTVMITAMDPDDISVPCYWGLTFDQSLPPLKPGLGYVGAYYNALTHSGATITVNLPLPSNYPDYLVFGVSLQQVVPGDPGYSGSITINYTSGARAIVYFSGVNASQSFTLPFTVPQPVPFTMDAGQSVTFITLGDTGGGTQPYSFQWYLDGKAVSGATASIWTYSPSSAGSHTIYEQITDSATTPVTATSASISVVVNAAPSVSISPISASLVVGQSQTFNSTVSGGTSPYSYQWYSNGVAVSGATGASWTFTPSSTGSYTVFLNVTDGLGSHATSSTATVTVGYVLTLSANTTVPNLAFKIVNSQGQTVGTYGSGSVVLLPGNYTITVSPTIYKTGTGKLGATISFVGWSNGSSIFSTDATITITLGQNMSLIADYNVTLRGIE